MTITGTTSLPEISSEKLPLETITVLLKEKLSLALQDLVEAGYLLQEAKQLLGHGNFCLWLKNNFKMSLKSANRFMSVASMVQRHNLEHQMVGQLMSLDLKGLYELAAKSTPKEVQEQVFQAISDGRQVNYPYIRFLKNRQKSPATQADDSMNTLANDLKNFSLSFQECIPYLQENPMGIGTLSRQELLVYADKLKQTYTVIEEILASADFEVDFSRD